MPQKREIYVKLLISDAKFDQKRGCCRRTELSLKSE
jgi:hypothetical protein